MRKWTFSLLMTFLCAVASVQAAPGDQGITIENAQLRVSFSPQNATVLSVEKRQGSLAYLGSSKQSGWFRIQVPLSYLEGNLAVSGELAAIKITRRQADSIEFQATRLVSKAGAYPITATLRFRLEGDNLVCSLSVDNQSEQTIDRVSFPILDVPPARDSGELLTMPHTFYPLRAMFSQNTIRNTHNPFDSLDPLDIRAWFFNDPAICAKGFDYPMILPTAWATYAADGKGISFDVRDKLIQYQKFIVERRLFRDSASVSANQRDYELSWNWYALIRPGSSWETPEIYIKFDQGDWHAVAKQHRDWLRTWIRRPPVPEGLRTAIGWMSRGLRSFDEIPDIARQGVAVGAPYLILYSWSQIGPEGMSYGGFPREEWGGIESLKENLQKAKDIGAYPMAWSNETNSTETNLMHQQLGHEWTALDRWGGQIVDGRWSFFEPLQLATTPNNDTWFEMDPSTGAGDYMVDTVRRFVEGYGFTGFEMDQGHKNYLSYRDRSEKARPEMAFTLGYGDVLSRSQAIVKKANPNGIIVGENPSELIGQYVDSIWIFEGGALNVPALNSLRYSMPWTTVPAAAVATDRGHANQAFMLNSPLDILGDLSNYPDYAAHLQRLHALKKATADLFYRGEFSDTDGFTLTANGDAGVTAKSYRDPGGKFMAVVAINTRGSEREATLRPDASAAAARAVRRYSLDGKVESYKPSPEMKLQMSPYDVQILVFDME